MPIDMVPPPPARAKRQPSTPRKTTPAKAVENPPESSGSPMFHARRQALSGLAQVGQMVCLTFGLKADAATIGMHAGPIATEAARLADTQPVAARIIDPLMVVGPYAAFMAVCVPFIVQIAANHKVGGASFAGMGAIPPEVLEARMEADMMRMELEAMRERQAMMQEADAARRQYAAMVAEEQAQQTATVQDGVDNRGWDPRLHASAVV